MWVKLSNVAIVVGVVSTACSAPDNRITEVSDVPFSHIVTPITRTFRGSVATTTDAASFSTGSYTPAADRILIATVQNTKASSPSAVNTFTGNGLTWNLIQTVVDNANIRRMTQFWAVTGTSPTTGAATADFGGVTQTSAHIRVDEFDGLDLTNPIGDTDIRNPSASNTSLSLALSFSSANNGTYAAIGYAGSSGSTPTASNITQISAVNLNTPSTWLMTGWDAGNQTAPGWTWPSSWDRWGAGFELLAAIAPHPNEPAGFTQITERDFVTLDELGWVDRDDLGSGKLAFVSDITDLVRTTLSSARSKYPAGMDGGTGPTLLEKTFTGYSEIYLDWDEEVSNPFQGHSSGVNKSWFVTRTGSASAPFYTSTQGAGSNNLFFQVRLQASPAGVGENTCTGAGCCGARNVPSNTQVSRGVRFRVELYAKMNSVDGSDNAIADGLLKVWINDTLRIDESNMAFRGKGTNGAQCGSGTAKFTAIKWNPTWGGTGDSLTTTQYKWLGYAYASGN